MSAPLRFIHASDVHLERLPSGLADLPDPLRRVLLDAPYKAALRVFELALEEQVDFIVIAGDLVDASVCEPRALLLLAEQFQRLDEKGISVYWAGGRVDAPENWPAAFPLPPGVRRFPQNRVERIVHARGNEPLAQILGTSCGHLRRVQADDFHVRPSELFTVAVAYGTVDSERLAEMPVDYWALGGEHNRRMVFDLAAVAHYCGSPQARRPKETGAHSCTLVDVDAARKISTRVLSTDSIRWHDEHIELAETATEENLLRLLVERSGQLVSAGGPDLIVSWRIAGPERLQAKLQFGSFAHQLMSELRGRQTQAGPRAWPISIAPALPANFPDAIYAQDTLLGEFLRTLREYEKPEASSPNVERFLSERQLAGSLSAASVLGEGDARAGLLRQAALLGAQLLGSEEPAS